MAGKKLLECSFLIPLRRDPNLSDGQLHEREAWLWLDEELYVFGGASWSGEPQEGWYIDPDTGERMPDLSKKFFVALTRKDVDRLRAILQQACTVFHQKCIYLS